jgi:hypothetical protein
VVASRTVNSAMELIVISQDGIVIRTRMDGIRMTGRSAQGVSVINVAPGDCVASLATIDMSGPANGGPKPEPESQQPPLAGMRSGKSPKAGGKQPEPAKPSAKKAPAKKPIPIKPKPKRK